MRNVSVVSAHLIILGTLVETPRVESLLPSWSANVDYIMCRKEQDPVS